MIFGSVCSGIEAASVAWAPLGWRASFFSEIDAFPRAVLSHRHPEVPLHGDFTTIRAGDYEPIELLVGGTPCQSFSVAGLRGGLGDDRGNLALEYLRLADRLRPRWLVWENVPGVLSSNGGRDFGSILGGMVKLGYGVAYRVLDAQFVRVDGLERAVPQRRRRVFIVGHIGDWRRTAAVLFERASLSGHPAPRREARKGVADCVAPSLVSNGDAHSGFRDEAGLIPSTGPVSHCLNAGGMGQIDYETETLIAAPQPIAFMSNASGANFTATQEFTPTLRIGGGGNAMAVAFNLRGRDGGAAAEIAESGLSPAITSASGGSTRPYVATPWQFHPTLCREPGGPGSQDWQVHAAAIQDWRVRRLTPRECERLQGFPDGYTDAPYRGKSAADSPRYKALGNSMAVNVMRWIGQRIALVDTLPLQAEAAA